MKKIKSIVYAALTVIFMTATLVSCNTDKCKDVVCKNGGTCLEGTCDCATGYYGSFCDSTYSTKLTGSYTCNETCPGVVAGANWSSIVSISSTTATNVVVTNFGNSGVSATLSVADGTVTVNPFTVGSFNVTGSGTYSGNVISITYTLANTSGSTTCSMTMTKL